MSMFRMAIHFAAIGAMLCLATGCPPPSQPADLPELHPVSVTVTQNGQPLAGATVVFAPESGSLGGSGITDATGQCQMRTNAKYDGLPVGQYKVGVKKYSEVQIPPELEALAESDPDAYDAKREELEAQGVKLEAELLTPTKYQSPASSGLEAEVPAGGATLTFELEGSESAASPDPS